MWLYAFLKLSIILYGTLKVYRWHLKKRWGSVDRSNELTAKDKVVVITGANSGIGKAAAKEFAERDANVILACRDPMRAVEAVNWIRTKTSLGKLSCMNLDLSSLDSIRQFCKDFQAKYDRLDILINNAGVVMPPEEKRRTADGFEIHMGVNHLGHFLLTNLLLETMKKGAPSRVVNVGSGLYSTSTLYLDDIMSDKDNIPPTPLGPSPLYNRSKKANFLFNIELAKRLKGSGVTTYGLCPGMVATELAQNFKGLTGMLANLVVQYVLPHIMMKSPEQGAATVMHCALSKKVANQSGEMYKHCGFWDPATEGRAPLKDEDAKKLWQISAKLVGLSGK